MTYQYITGHTAKYFTKGRPYGIDSITIHHWDDPDKRPKFDNIVRIFEQGERRNSAHYVVEAGRVACLVDPDDRAWACGDGVGRNSGGNDRSISIECNPRQQDGDYETIAELVRNLRKTYGDLPLYPHRHWASTDCPGTYDLARIDRLARNGSDAPATSTPDYEILTVDGIAGNATVRRWQQVMGTPVDGVITGQVRPDNRTYGRPSLTAVAYGPGGSALVRAVQRTVGTYADGLLGPDTIRAVQRRLGVTADAWMGKDTVRALQTRLNENRF